MILKKVSFWKILYKILTVILSIYWAIFGFGFACNCISRVYLYPVKYKAHVLENAEYYGLDSLLIFSIIKVESGFNPDAKSKAGAIGLMQITEDTGEYIAKMQGVESYDLSDAHTNITFGCFYLKYLLLKFENQDTALCAYNAGEGNVNSWLNNEKYSKDKKTLLNIPFPETRNYVKKINETFVKYKKLYENILDK
ncbi:MAG: lytic transglycosylase domain-containing protein [Clostridia bacterium]|nr:lytic transglycosylase domain-containing protein [Clostridia bacterium]